MDLHRDQHVNSSIVSLVVRLYPCKINIIYVFSVSKPLDVVIHISNDSQRVEAILGVLK